MYGGATITKSAEVLTILAMKDRSLPEHSTHTVRTTEWSEHTIKGSHDY